MIRLVLTLLAGWGALAAVLPPVRITRHTLRIRPPRPALSAAVVVSAFAGAVVTGALFGAALPTAAGAMFGGTFPPAIVRRREERRREQAAESWPRLIEEIRVLTGASGRSVPQALFEAGSRAPAALRPAFALAGREWAMTTDLGRAVAVLKVLLADPAADSVLETLLVAHEIGGGDLDRRLQALADHRTQEIDARRDARAEQAGARFARRFVLLVPAGMALAGQSIGPGRSGYATPSGQAAVCMGIAVIAGCWAWAGHIMRVPEPYRVLGR